MIAQLDMVKQRWKRPAIKIRKSKTAPDILTWKTGRRVTNRSEKTGKVPIFGVNNSKQSQSPSHVSDTFPKDLTLATPDEVGTIIIRVTIHSGLPETVSAFTSCPDLITSIPFNLKNIQVQKISQKVPLVIIPQLHMRKLRHRPFEEIFPGHVAVK